MNPLTTGRCWTCDRTSCVVIATRAASDLAWGAFDAAKARAGGYRPDLKPLRDAAFESSNRVTRAEQECQANKVNWRVRALTAERALAVFQQEQRR